MHWKKRQKQIQYLSGEARQRSKPRKGIPGPKGRAADSAMLERHAGRDCSSSSTAWHETIWTAPRFDRTGSVAR